MAGTGSQVSGSVPSPAAEGGAVSTSTTADPSTLPSSTSARRSARLAGVRPQDNVDKELVYSYDNPNIQTTDLWCKYKTEEYWTVFSSRTDAQPEIFKPGMVIWAPLHVHHTDLAAKYHNACVRRTVCGPVHSKLRPMVVLWSTQRGVLALPLFSVAENLRKLTDERRREYVSMVGLGDGWEGETPWCKVLHWVQNESHSEKYPNATKRGFVDVAHPVVLEFMTPTDVTPGSLTQDSYRELVRYYEFRNKQNRKRAFDELEQAPPTPIKTPGLPVKKGTKVVDSEGFERLISDKEAREQMERYVTLIGPVPKPLLGSPPKKRKISK